MTQQPEPRTDPRIVRSERAILDAATDLFVRQGYAATTMGQVAAAAGVAERTVFVRFTTKAELFRRAMDETLAAGFAAANDPGPAAETGPDADLGPDADGGGAGVPWFVRATQAPTLEERLAAGAHASATAMAHSGPMFAVAREAEAVDADIAAAFAAARNDTLASARRMWQNLADDGLLHPDVDVEWAANTTGLLAGADTYLMIRATLAWDRQQLEDWLYRTWLHLATTPSRHNPSPTNREPPRSGP